MSEAYRYRESLEQVRWKEILPVLEEASDTMARFDERMDRDDALAGDGGVFISTGPLSALPQWAVI
jgi:hypothetical protein